MRRTRGLAALLLTGSLLAGACSDDDDIVDAGGPASEERLPEREDCNPFELGQGGVVPEGCTTVDEVGRGQAQEYETTATVIEVAGGGPRLCVGAVLASLPPGCSGVRLDAWDWDEVDDEQTIGDTTFGSYAVRGTYIDETFTLTARPRSLPQHAPGELPAAPAPDLGTPCREPAGGWRVVDPATTTEAAIHEANLYAQGQADYGAFWTDHSLNPAIADGYQPEDGMWVTEPTKVILNASFTGELERHEVELRELWGGPLCVSRAKRGWGELTRIAGDLMTRPGILSTSPDGVHGVVRVGVVVDDGLQERMGAEFGEGTVVVEPELRPVDD